MLKMVVVSINPTTGKQFAKYDEINRRDLEEIIKRAKEAGKAWFNLRKNARIKVIHEIKGNILENQEELKQLIRKETGFFEKETQDIIYDVLDGIEYYIKKYRRNSENINFPIDQEVFPKTKVDVIFEPKGVIGQIGIWNYPLWQTMISTIPALLTGNSIVYKPSEYSTATGLYIDKLINSTSIPKYVFNTVIGGKDIGKEIVKSDVDMIVYTGNIPTGEDIRKNAGTKSLLLEMSGNDAAIVTKECDLEKTLSGIASGVYLHSGEVCDRIKRIYVEKEISDIFIKRLTEKVKGYRLENDISPLIRREAVEKAHKQVMKTVNEGAEILAGGYIPKTEGFYYPATLILAHNPKAYALREEIFAPVATIYVVNEKQEAIREANSTVYGLGASVWTENYDEGRQIAKNLDAGIVWINDSNIPLVLGEYFTGHKSSGISTADDRLKIFQKSKVIVENKQDKREWWSF